MYTKKNKVVMLLGAGFANIWDAPTTTSITDVLREDKLFRSITGQSLGDWVFHRLSNVYHSENDAPINFEQILNYIEMLQTYFQSKYRIGGNSWRNASHAFLDVNESLYEILDFHRIYKRQNKKYIIDHPSFIGKWNDYDDFFNTVYRYYLQLIYKEVKRYCEESHMNKFQSTNELCKQFINFFQTSERLNIYTTNYDRNIPNLMVGKFSEGFTIDTGQIWQYNMSEVLKGPPRSYFNIHGSIFHSNNFHKGFCIDPNVNPILVNTAFYKDQEGRSLLSPNIIAGLNKSSGILRSPFSEYYHRFYNDCLHADLIIIAGYSFGDLHINNALKTGGVHNPSQQLRIIDFMAAEEENLMERYEHDWVDHIGRFGRSFIGDSHPFYKILTKENDKNFRIFRKGINAFLERKEWETTEMFNN